VLRFSHEKKCGDNYCEGFFVMAHEKSRQYGLMCVYHTEGDSPEAKRYNDGSEQKYCQMVRTGKWRVKLDGDHMGFYSDPQTLAAVYRVTSEQ
jgi:hypothetical protein